MDASGLSLSGNDRGQVVHTRASVTMQYNWYHSTGSNGWGGNRWSCIDSNNHFTAIIQVNLCYLALLVKNWSILLELSITYSLE